MLSASHVHLHNVSRFHVRTHDNVQPSMASVLSPHPVMVPLLRCLDHVVAIASMKPEGAARACLAPCRAPGLVLGEQHVDRIDGATSSTAATSQPEILKGYYEIEALGTERNDFLCSVMPGMKVYDSIMDVQGCGDKVATQMGDDPEDQDDPLPPHSQAIPKTRASSPLALCTTATAASLLATMTRTTRTL